MATSQGGYVDGGFDLLKAPDAPTITSVTTGFDSASVAFTAPTNVGGAPITSYTVTAVNESTGASTGAVGTSSPISLSLSPGTFKIRAAATNIYGPGRVTAYETGKQIFAGAGVWSWGEGTQGRLGTGNVIDRSSPVQIGSLATWKSSSMGETGAFAVKTDGTLWAWGYNPSGQLGTGDSISRSSPVQVGALTNWSIVSAGVNKCASIKTDGTLWAWGVNGGALGNGVISSAASPIQIGSLTSWRQVSFNYTHSGAVRTNNTAWTWGSNGNGQLGQNNTINTSSPVQVGTLTNWSQLSVGPQVTFATKTDGTLWAWGQNNSGQLGDGTTTLRSSPVQIGSATNWASVRTTGSTSNAAIHTFAITTGGELYAWGNDASGCLGTNGVAASTPTRVGALTNWRQAAATNYSSAAVKTDGTLWAWGDNSSGQIGDGTRVNKSSPVQVGSLTQWLEVSSGGTSGTGRQTLALYGVT
jgi:alpha-tubulin suppressor-like RCC1 family protein